MISKYIDMPVGLTKVKRAEAMLLRISSGDVATLDRSELVNYTRAFATIVIAAQQGLRLAPEVFILAESVAYSRNFSSPAECGPGSGGGR